MPTERGGCSHIEAVETVRQPATIQPDDAYYHDQLNEFILSYEAVRAAASPEAAIAAFVDSTYRQAATSAGWDRPALERPLLAIPRR